MSKGAKFWVKNLFFFQKPAACTGTHKWCTGTIWLLSNFAQGVPVHIEGVPVHFGHCPFLSKLYRYTFRVYRYTCSNLIFFFSFFFFLSLFFLYIYFSNLEQWCRCKIWPCQLPSIRVSLHAHFFFYSDSTQMTVFIELVTVIPSLDTFNLSMGPTAVPMIRVPRVRLTWQLKAQNGCKR